MSGPAPDPDKEAEEDIPMEGDGCLFSGIEVHVRMVNRAGRPGIDFPYRPAAGDRKIPGRVPGVQPVDRGRVPVVLREVP